MIRDKTLELFSANWNCNRDKPSFVKYGNEQIMLGRGVNILGFNDSIKLIMTYDCCIDDYARSIQLKLKELYDGQEYDYLIFITHDDATCKTHPDLLQNYLIFMDCKLLEKLSFRGSYLMIFDLKKREIVYEVCDNQFPIHEWFYVDDKLEHLGIPVYLIVYNSLHFTKKSVEQLRKYTRNIHIIDNKSDYPPLLQYYDNEYEFFLDRQQANYGHTVWMNQMFWQFPRIFAITDPDLEFNVNLPNNFLEILNQLTHKYKKGKVGFALDISDAELFYQDKNYTLGASIEEWEKRFWIKKIDNSEYELYDAGIDTTFCVVNKEFKETGNAIRVAGDFTCKHIPWYQGWQKQLGEEEWNYYKMNNISSGTIKMMMSSQLALHNDLVQMYEETQFIINKIDELSSKIAGLDIKIESESLRNVKMSLANKIYDNCCDN